MRILIQYVNECSYDCPFFTIHEELNGVTYCNKEKQPIFRGEEIFPPWCNLQEVI
jgi:hypothetical protein